MGILQKVKDAVEGVKETVRALDESMPPLPADKSKPAPAPKKKPGDAKFARGLGERIGFAGIVALTVGAALFGAVGCRPESGPAKPTPTVVATCEEDQSWCWDCRSDGNRRCGADDGAVQR